MRPFAITQWLKSPADRDIIARWTVGRDGASSHALAFPPPPDPSRFTFLVVGDTGDSENAGPRLSPQCAVAHELARDAGLPGNAEHARAFALPGNAGGASFVLHTGDVVYMTGERRLYDRNFRAPYAAFLTSESTADHLTFQLPFLPVPGNHDYYDLGEWALWLSRMPVVGPGLRALLQRLFAFQMPEGGSDMGRAFMEAFVDAEADTTRSPLAYLPGKWTRLPNRYYRFRVGDTDLFALDSNTLDAPPGADVAERRAHASARIGALEQQAETIDRDVRHYQRQVDQWRTERRQTLASSSAERAHLEAPSRLVEAALQELHVALASVPPGAGRNEAMARQERGVRRWREAWEEFEASSDTATAEAALHALQEASDEVCDALRAIEGVTTGAPAGAARTALIASRDRAEQALQAWSERVEPLPEELCARLREVSEKVLDIQRELAMARRRARFRPEDHDAAQLAWLDAALTESVRLNPDGWRIVYLHHPLYSAIANHCERPDVQDARANLLPLLEGRVHLVLSGHSHAFEWIRSARLPHTGLFVTGGGGQITLRPSILSPGRLARNRDRYAALRAAGVEEYAAAGSGPAAPDGVEGPLYHYLRVEVTPECLRVRPVGVRRMSIASGAYRREEPMPVYHAASLPEARPPWQTRQLSGVEIRRDAPPSPLWV